MTVDEVKKQVAEIIRVGGHDDEQAHCMEDDLHQAVLRAIADGCDNAAELAREALKTTGGDFARWCA